MLSFNVDPTQYSGYHIVWSDLSNETSSYVILQWSTPFSAANKILNKTWGDRGRRAPRDRGLDSLWNDAWFS